jgi:hypothetical protein
MWRPVLVGDDDDPQQKEQTLNDNDNSIVRTEFDRILAGLDGLPDVSHAGPSTIRSVSFIGTGQTFILSTYRMRDKGDTIFLETISSEGSLRLVIPPAVADAIARQRDALTTKVRRRVGKASAEARKLRGELPGFMKHKKAGKATK